MTKNNFREFKVLRKLPPEHFWGCFLYQTDLFSQTKELGNLQIVQGGRNLKILGDFNSGEAVGALPMGGKPAFD